MKAHEEEIMTLKILLHQSNSKHTWVQMQPLYSHYPQPCTENIQITAEEGWEADLLWEKEGLHSLLLLAHINSQFLPSCLRTKVDCRTTLHGLAVCLSQMSLWTDMRRLQCNKQDTSKQEKLDCMKYECVFLLLIDCVACSLRVTVFLFNVMIALGGEENAFIL